MKINILELNVAVPSDVLREAIDLTKFVSYIEGIGWTKEIERGGNFVYAYHSSGFERIILPKEVKPENIDIVLGVAYKDALEAIYRTNRIPSLTVLNAIVGLSLGDEKEDEISTETQNS